MGGHRNFVVWVWYEGDTPTYVGWGSCVGMHPAYRIWLQRHGKTSDLTLWLQNYDDKEPKRVDHNGIVGYYQDEAIAIAQALRDISTSEGHKLLEVRPWGTKEGGGSARKVMGPDFTVYNSVRQAGNDIGVDPGTITRWCQSEKSDWSYLN